MKRPSGYGHASVGCRRGGSPSVTSCPPTRRRRLMVGMVGSCVVGLSAVLAWSPAAGGGPEEAGCGCRAGTGLAPAARGGAAAGVPGPLVASRPVAQAGIRPPVADRRGRRAGPAGRAVPAGRRVPAQKRSRLRVQAGRATRTRPAGRARPTAPHPPGQPCRVARHGQGPTRVTWPRPAGTPVPAHRSGAAGSPPASRPVGLAQPSPVRSRLPSPVPRACAARRGGPGPAALAPGPRSPGSGGCQHAGVECGAPRLLVGADAGRPDAASPHQLLCAVLDAGWSLAQVRREALALAGYEAPGGLAVPDRAGGGPARRRWSGRRRPSTRS
jgi:hypothetical protein